MRIAILSDIHGNSIALDAVLADARRMEVDGYWVLGDHVAIGPEPGAVLDRLLGLDNVLFTRGNTDRYVVTGELPPPTLGEAQVDGTLVPVYASMKASFAWTKGFVTAHGTVDWLAQLPLDIRFRCADGVRVLAVHASPGTDDGEGVHPGMSNAQIGAVVAGADADLIIVGHTHEPMVRRVGRQVVVNLGSVSNPKAGDLRASYVMLEGLPGGSTITHRRVEYDSGLFADSVRKSRHPATDYILSFQRGERGGRARHRDDISIVPGAEVHIAPEAVDLPQ
jgi:predicted phosphodiesterase